MKLFPVSPDSVPLKQPLPFALRAESGAVLARKGYVIESRTDLERIAGLGVELFINEDEHKREYMTKLQSMIQGDANLGDIAQAHLSVNDITRTSAQRDTELPRWEDMLSRANALLRDPKRETFHKLLDELHSDIQRHIARNADETLFALMHLSATELRSYSALHAMLVCALVEMAAGQVLDWPQSEVLTVGQVALTMNVSMTAMQDELALQTAKLTATQKHMIEVHAAYSAEVLKDLGVTDELWLEAVFHHLDKKPGPLAPRPAVDRLARLVQRANLFAAMMAPRASRDPLQPGVAMQACYYDENGEVDEAGAALIKVMGIYSPGCYVRLATQEIAVVVRRGPNTTTPRVAVLVNRNGMPMAEPVFRDTSQRDYRVVATVAHRDMRVKLSLQRLLAMV